MASTPDRGTPVVQQRRVGACEGPRVGLPEEAVEDARYADSDDTALEEILADALLGELEAGQRAAILRMAAARLARSPGPAEPRASLGPSAGLALPAAHRPRPGALPTGGPHYTTLPSYRVIIDRREEEGSRVAFAAHAPSARGAVAAQLRTGVASVSATNEAEPADRCSWGGRRSCCCTPPVFGDEAQGRELDREGRCPDCGLQVLPPEAPAIAGHRRIVGIRRRLRRALSRHRLKAGTTAS